MRCGGERCEPGGGRACVVWWRHDKRHARGRGPTQGLGAKGTRGAHVEHAVHVRDAGGVEAQRLGGGGGDGGGSNCTSKDLVPSLPYAKEKVCPKPGADHSAPFQPSPYESVMSRVHIAPSATVSGTLEVYGAPPLSVVSSEQLRLQPTSLGYDPLEQTIVEEVDVGSGEGGGGEGDGGLAPTLTEGVKVSWLASAQSSRLRSQSVFTPATRLNRWVG